MPNSNKMASRLALVFVLFSMLSANVQVMTAEEKTFDIIDGEDSLPPRQNIWNKYIEEFPPEVVRLITQNEDGIQFLNDLYKTAKELSISPGCINDTRDFIKGVTKGDSWALQMLDAIGKPRSGITAGELSWTGSYSICKTIQAVRNNSGIMQETFKGKYCLVNLMDYKVIIPNPIGAPGPLTIKLGVCQSNRCNESDTKNIFNLFLKLNNFTSSIDVGDVKCSVPTNELTLSSSAIAMIVLLVTFGLVMLIGTSYDVFLVYKPWIYKKDEDMKSILGDFDKSSIDVNHQNLHNNVQIQAKSSSPTVPHTKFEQFFLAFSVYTNASKMLSTEQSKEALTCLNGIRFISMTWVILGHTYYFGVLKGVIGNLNTFGKDLTNRRSFGVIANATVSVDTFFVLSGLLTSYLFFIELKRVESLKRIKWPLFYFHRFWRLTPPYMLVMGVYSSIFYYLWSGPNWTTDVGVEPNCKNNWWQNFLYINNFFDVKDQCFAWSWYLANDMQFYILSPLFFITLAWKPKVGLTLLSLLTVLSVIARGIISQNQKSILGTFDFDKMYDKPWNRIGPYVIGIITGYLLQKCQRKIYMRWWVALSGWCVAAFFCLIVMYGPYDAQRTPDFSLQISSLYNSVFRIIWAIGVSWVMFACCTGYGGWVNNFLSWKLFVPLSRLTYCAYLVHPCIMYFFYDSRETSFVADDPLMLYLFIGNLVLAYVLAFVTSLTFESPFMGLEKVFLKR